MTGYCVPRQLLERCPIAYNDGSLKLIERSNEVYHCAILYTEGIGTLEELIEICLEENFLKIKVDLQELTSLKQNKWLKEGIQDTSSITQENYEEIKDAFESLIETLPFAKPLIKGIIDTIRYKSIDKNKVLRTTRKLKKMNLNEETLTEMAFLLYYGKPPAEYLEKYSLTTY